MSNSTISAREFAELCQQRDNIELIDVRTPAEYHEVHVENGLDARCRAAFNVDQVRIAAGSLVLLGILLAWLVHPSFVGLSAFVGAGLVFAGITDTCGMGMILARMPWNQQSGSSVLQQ